jgi:hypothetical protein
MKKIIILTVLSVLAFCVSATMAQDADEKGYRSSRLDNLANRLKRQTVDLADRSSEDLRRGGGASTRSDIEAAFLAQQLDASAGLFQQMVTDSRRARELRDGAAILSDLARRAPGYGSNSYMWREAQNIINDINRELGGGGGNDDGGNNNVTGRAFWRGKVDIETQLFIRGNNLETRVVAGPNWGGESFSFTSPLPTRKVEVSVNKKKGRGDVRVLQQPSRENDWTAVVQILDPGSGAKDYELEIFWR